jgi:hypothetical protein
VARLPTAAPVGSILVLAILVVVGVVVWKVHAAQSKETDIGGGRVVELPHGGEVTVQKGPLGDGSVHRTDEVVAEGALEAIYVDKVGGGGVEGVLVDLYGRDLKLLSRPRRLGEELAFMASGTASIAGKPAAPTRIRVIEKETEAWILAASGPDGFPDSAQATAFLQSFNLK